MRSASGQGTVEYIGVLLVVAVLIGAVAGGFGLPRLTAGIASSITRAFLGKVGVTERAQDVASSRPSAADRAAFARALDAGVSPDDRPSLRDVRLALIRQHGDERGRAIYRELVLADLRDAVPGLGGPTLFATATSGPPGRGASGGYLPINGDLSLVRPAGDDQGEVETPIGEPSAHVVTLSEADSAFDHALHPGISYTGIALDLASIAPAGRLASGAVKGFIGLTRVGARLAKLARAGGKLVSASTNVVTLADDALSLAPDANASPAGSREGDEIVSWLAARCPANGGPARQFLRSAVVRDGAVILEGIRWPGDGRPPSLHPDPATPDPTTEEGC
jgi:hypothetical protein